MQTTMWDLNWLNRRVNLHLVVLQLLNIPVENFRESVHNRTVAVSYHVDWDFDFAKLLELVQPYHF